MPGTHYGGVKAEDNGKKLTYYAETMDVTGIALGSMKWGTTTGRTSSGLYFFNNVSSVNASGLSFTNPDEVSGSMELLSGATDLAANKMVTGADHSQSFDKAMTNGVSLSSTLTGTVSTTAAVVKYTARPAGRLDKKSFCSSLSITVFPTASLSSAAKIR